jgi:hypothetical protein
MTDTLISPAANPVIEPAPVLTPEEIEANKAADAQAAETAALAAKVKKAHDEQVAKDKAAADAIKAKQKSAHIVTVVAGKPKNGIALSTGNDGTPIPRDGVLTIALISTANPSGAGHHPGTDIACIARLPDKSEIGDVVEAYCIPGDTGSSAFVHPPKGESIGILPVSTGNNVGTCVEVPATAGRSFRKTSAAAWQVMGA